MPGTALLERVRAALAPEFTVLEEIAAGGQGHVFRAHHPRLRRDVAIKVLRPELATAGAAARFLREAQLLARLKHPNILAVHDAGEADGLSYYVMDLAEGETLASRVGRGRLSEAELLALARDILGALGAAHRAGVVHRDVKPANIFLQDSRAQLGDFGVAHVATGSTDSAARSEPGRVLGTTGYMSPEQLLGTATPRSDVYSAASVLFEAATGSVWIGAGDPNDADWARVPPALAGPLRKALELDPRARWPDAKAFLRAVERPGRARSLPGWTKVVAAVALVAGATVLYRVVSARADAAGPGRMATTELAIVPFRGGDALGRHLASFVASALEWSPHWTFRPYHEVLGWWDSAGSQADAVAARRLNAEHWVDGFIRRDTLVLRINSLRGGAGILKVPGDSADIVQWANTAADSIVRRVFPQRAAEFRELMSGSSGDYEANRLLIAGTEAFELDRWDAAEKLLKAALARDPRLYRAAFELDLLHRWRRAPPDEELAAIVQAASARLPEPYGSLMRSERELDLRRRLSLLQAVAREYPENARARFLLINESFHRAPLLGIPLEEVLEMMEEGIRSSPYLNQVAMYDHLVWGYIHLGMEDSTRSALRRRTALLDGRAVSDEFGPLLDLASRARFSPLVARVWAWGALQRYRSDPGVLARMLRFALTFDVPELQRQLAAGLAGSADPRVRTTARMAEGLALLELGRIREGLDRVDSAAARLGPGARVQALAWRVVPASLGIPMADSASRSAAAAELATIAGGQGPGAAEAAWILALDGTERGRLPDWRARSQAGAPDTSASAGYLATILQGIDLAGRGMHDAALTVTAPAIIDDSSGAVGSAFARAVLHISRGAWQRALARPVEADRSWLFYQNSHLRGYPDGVVQAGEVDAVLSVYARLLRAELALAQGESMRACRLARRADDLWAGADSLLSSLRARTRRVLEQCE
jgi:hypothetical protein